MTTQRGFTLIEMAIVLVIITILIGGLAMPLSAQIQARRVAETKKTLEEARDALMGYAMMTTITNPATPGKITRYFPCPDTVGTGYEGARDLSSGNCINGTTGGVSYGWLPWVTLGTASQDAWGNRLRYVVASQFANSKTGFSRSTPLGGTPPKICSTSSCSALVANNVVFALVSHGPNGWGALNISTVKLAQPTGADEIRNLALSSDLVMRTPTTADSALGEFDDLVAWMSQPELTAHVCPIGSDCDQ
ncbi:MAG TPA: prepilin-type N-terminal cleavage/methylation domain-containing protein [Thiobacillus sp.]